MLGGFGPCCRSSALWQQTPSRRRVQPGVCSLVDEQTLAKVLGCTRTLLEIPPDPILGPGFQAGGEMYSSRLVRWGALAGKLLRCRSRCVTPALEGIKLWDMPHILLQDRLLFASKGKPWAFCADPVDVALEVLLVPLPGDSSSRGGALSCVTWDAAGAWGEQRGSHSLFLALFLRNVSSHACRSPGKQPVSS